MTFSFSEAIAELAALDFTGLTISQKLGLVFDLVEEIDISRTSTTTILYSGNLGSGNLGAFRIADSLANLIGEPGSVIDGRAL